MVDCLKRASRFALLFAALLLVAASAACGSSDDRVTNMTPVGGNGCERSDAGEDGDTAAVDAGLSASSCQPVVQAHANEGAAHSPLCSPLTYATNPPSSGSHYPIWAAYQTYTKPFPRGFWVHSLEHGAVVITYNCPEGCAGEVAAAQAFIDALPTDCASGARRIILTPDPELDVRFAASAWGFTLKAKCFDRCAFSTFVADHYDDAPESICGGGVDPTGGSDGPPICS
jgi:hypothetical protein